MLSIASDPGPRPRGARKLQRVALAQASGSSMRLKDLDFEEDTKDNDEDGWIKPNPGNEEHWRSKRDS